MDIFVLPSLREGVPLAILEAMAMKKPVVATRVGGLPGMIRSGENGILVEPKDPGALSKAILSLLNDSDKAKLCAENGRSTVEAMYSVEHMAQQYKKVYEEVTKNRRVM